MRKLPAIIDEEEPAALAMQPIMRQQPQGRNKVLTPEQQAERGRTGGISMDQIRNPDPDQPEYTFPLPKGSMTGKPYPTEEEFGGGDGFYSQVYRWEKDNGAFGLEYNSPEYKKFLEDYAARMARTAKPPAPKAQGMFGRPPGGMTANRMMIDE
jgi:hypothetical protein